MSFLNFPPSPLRIIFQDLPLAGCGKLQVKSQLSTEDGATEQQVGGTVCVPVSVTGSETLSSEGGSRHPNSPRDPTRCSAGEKSTCRNAAGQLTGLSLQVPLSHLDVGHCKKKRCIYLSGCCTGPETGPHSSPSRDSTPGPWPVVSPVGFHGLRQPPTPRRKLGSRPPPAQHRGKASGLRIGSEPLDSTPRSSAEEGDGFDDSRPCSAPQFSLLQNGNF